MAYSDEDLMDYADGALDEEMTAEIDAAIATDPELLERVDQFRSSFTMLALADDLAQSTVPSLDEMEQVIAARDAVQVTPAREAVQESTSQSYGLIAYLRARIVVALVSLSLTFAGGVAATVGLIGWRVQQFFVGIQASGAIGALRGSEVQGLQSGYPNTPVWLSQGPLVFNVEVLESRLIDSTSFRRRLGYLSEGGKVPFKNRILRVNYRIDGQKFLDAQGFWCLVFGNCESTGKLSLIYTDENKVEHLYNKMPRKVAPGELETMATLKVSSPAGTNKIKLRLEFADQKVEKSVAFEVIAPPAD